MTDPAVAACLTAPYSSKPSQRGGTLIAEDVRDLEDHRHWVGLVDAYRPDRCASCLCPTLHGHGLRSRLLRMGVWSIEEEIRRFRCQGCGGIWQVLPAVIARWLHRTWGVVQSAAQAAGAIAGSGGEPREPAVPRRTVRRWVARLGLMACVLVQVLSSSVETSLPAVETGATRGELVEALVAADSVGAANKLADVAGWIHRVVPGVRLM